MMKNIKHEPAHYLRFQFLTAANKKFRVFWDVLPCSQIDVDRRFRGVCCLHHQGPEDSELLLIIIFSCILLRPLRSKYSFQYNESVVFP
jgi:hypothetical protein